jgi:acetyl esterase/lipase
MARDAQMPAPPGQTVSEQRAARELAYADRSRDAVKTNGVTTTEIAIAGVPCLEIAPAEAAPGRAVVYLFGGGFVFGSPWQDMTICAGLATGMGTRVIAPFYRLAPEHPFPAALNDCAAVLEAVLKQTSGATYLAGESAGANLALAISLQRFQQNLPGPLALGLMSPSTDQTDYGDSYLTNRDPVLARERIDAVPRIYAPGADLTDPLISPIFGTYGPGFPPTLITTGTRDLFLSSCARQARVMREAGATVDLRVWEGMWHAFEFYAELPESAASLSDISTFLLSAGPDRSPALP